MSHQEVVGSELQKLQVVMMMMMMMMMVVVVVVG